MIQPAKTGATYEDVLNAPEGIVAELIGGELHLQPRPARSHSKAVTRLLGLLVPPYELGRGGHGGWEFLVEPELHLGDDVLVPDVAGWRRQSVPDFDGGAEVAFERVRPDWVCEVLSKSTEKKDREKKLPLYMRAGIGHVWLLDPRARALSVYSRGEVVTQVVGNMELRAEPFVDVSIGTISDLWAPTRC